MDVLILEADLGTSWSLVNCIKAIVCDVFSNTFHLTFSNWIGWSRMVILHSYDILWVYYCMSFFTVWCNEPWASNSLRVASNYQTAPTLKACYLWPCHRPASWRCDGCSGDSFNGKEHTGILYSWFFAYVSHMVWTVEYARSFSSIYIKNYMLNMFHFFVGLSWSMYL